MKKMDIIIVSDSSREQFRDITQNAIDSCHKSSQNIKFNIIIVETSGNKVNYNGANVVMFNQKFTYNGALNFGLNYSTSEYIALCNNDLVFIEGWADEIIKAFDSNPALYSQGCIMADGKHDKEYGIKFNSGLKYGYEVRRFVTGWIICLVRDTLDMIGKFDANFEFWFADNDYAKCLERKKLKHALNTHSKVHHLESQTLNTFDKQKYNHMTNGQFNKFKKKWQR